jgi:hypothetical protein
MTDLLTTTNTNTANTANTANIANTANTANTVEFSDFVAPQPSTRPKQKSFILVPSYFMGRFIGAQGKQLEYLRQSLSNDCVVITTDRNKQNVIVNLRGVEYCRVMILSQPQYASRDMYEVQTRVTQLLMDEVVKVANASAPGVEVDYA